MIKINDDTFKQALNRLAATDDGQIFLAYIKIMTGWDDVYLSTEDATVTQYYAARRGVYGGIRKLIKPEYLKSIEFNYEKDMTNGSESKQRTNTLARKSTK